MAGVSFEGVEKTYANGVTAIVHLDVEIDDGELAVVIGPSGSGKSTLLRLLAGLEEPTGGLIRIGGMAVNRKSPQERNIAMVFQDYALYPTMTVRENLEFPLKMRAIRSAERIRRVRWVEDLLDLGPLLDRLPRQLSGGQRQRVAMGRALVREPSVFLLDEPLSNLDPQLRAQVRTEIGDLQRRTGCTMIYVTHDQIEAMTLGQRIAVLHQGRLRQIARPRALYDRPADTFVARFIGSPPMNLFPARLESVGEQILLHLGELSLPLPTAVPPAPLGQPLIGGIRPESIRPCLEPHGSFPATVLDTEFIGHETLVHFSPQEDPELRMVARLPGAQPLQHGSTLRLSFLFQDLRFFGPDGRALT